MRTQTLTPQGATAHGHGTPRSRRREALASVTIGAIAFLIVTGETLPVGLIGAVARGVGASQSQLGLVVSWYALVAAVSAVPLTRWSSRFDRRHVLLGCATLFGVAQVTAAVATNLPLLVIGRGLGAMCHGLYFAVAAPAVIRVARPEAKGRAGGRVAVGASSALVLGTPLATLLGQMTTWRVAMLAVAGLSLVLAAAVTRVLPRLPAVPEAARSGGVVPTLQSPGLGVVLSVTFVIVAAHFALFTYVAPFAGEGLGIDGRAFTVVLLLYGTAAVLGSTLAGRLAELGPVSGVRAAAATFVAALTGVWLAERLDVVAAGLPRARPVGRDLRGARGLHGTCGDASRARPSCRDGERALRHRFPARHRRGLRAGVVLLRGRPAVRRAARRRSRRVPDPAANAHPGPSLPPRRGRLIERPPSRGARVRAPIRGVRGL